MIWERQHCSWLGQITGPYPQKHWLQSSTRKTILSVPVTTLLVWWQHSHRKEREKQKQHFKYIYVFYILLKSMYFFLPFPHSAFISWHHITCSTAGVQNVQSITHSQFCLIVALTFWWLSETPTHTPGVSLDDALAFSLEVLHSKPSSTSGLLFSRGGLKLSTPPQRPSLYFHKQEAVLCRSVDRGKSLSSATL